LNSSKDKDKILT